MLIRLITIFRTLTIIVNQIDQLDCAILYLLSIGTGNW